MDQPALWHESLTDALNDCIRALGGNKTVGALLWPEKTIDDARRTLLDAMNPERAQKLSPEQVLLLLKEARKVNCHAAFTYMARECGYADPVPVEPEDQHAALQREFTQAVKALAAITSRMDRVGLRVAA